MAPLLPGALLAPQLTSLLARMQYLTPPQKGFTAGPVGPQAQNYVPVQQVGDGHQEGAGARVQEHLRQGRSVPKKPHGTKCNFGLLCRHV